MLIFQSFKKLQIIHQLKYTLTQQQQIIQEFSHYPVLDLHSLQPVQYDSKYNQMTSLLQIVKKNKYEVIPEKINFFLADQIQKDFSSLHKSKEIIFIGRSNSGKSSLINTIFNQKLCLVSKTQGSTKKLYFNELVKNQGFIIDAPGYGYTQTSTDSKKKWFQMIESYTKVSSRLCQIYLMVNIHHGLKQLDEEVIQQLLDYKINIKIVFTKADKIKTIQQIFEKVIPEIQKLKNIDTKNMINNMVHVTSAREKMGIIQLKQGIMHGLINFEPRNYDQQEHKVLFDLLGYVPKQINEHIKTIKTIKQMQHQHENQINTIKQKRNLLK